MSKDFKTVAFCPYRFTLMNKDCILNRCVMYTPLSYNIEEQFDSSVYQIHKGICELVGKKFSVGENVTGVKEPEKD